MEVRPVLIRLGRIAPALALAAGLSGGAAAPVAAEAAFFADDDSRTHLACHEIGHSIGLRHWGNPPISDGPTAATCMNADTPNGPVGLHGFDRNHINVYYARPADRLAKRCMSEV
jgi:hypothetical protein